MKLKSYRYLLLLSALFFGEHEIKAQRSVKDLEEFHQRDGLPNFFRKINLGEQVSIAYLGGSITEAQNGWRDMTYDWLVNHYPKARFTQINATIGGTGSNLGVFRLERDVLVHHPDLVFVEFAVNDGSTPAEAIHVAMEGIVRKIWKQDSDTDICFVYTLAENGVKSLQEGNFQPPAEAMEQIAGHYQIPSIHMGVEVVKLLEADKLIFTGNPEEHPDKIVFTKDKTHPISASGHPIYAEVVERSFVKMEGVRGRRRHSTAEVFKTGNWENAKMIPLSTLDKTGKWQDLSSDNELLKRFARSMSFLSKTDQAGASLTIKFKGKVLGVYDVIGPESGIIEVVVDGKPPFEVTRFDAYCNYFRRNAFFLKDLSDGEHQVTFTVSGKALDKAAILAKRNIPFENPGNYAVNGWLVNSVLLVGEVIK